MIFYIIFLILGFLSMAVGISNLIVSDFQPESGLVKTLCIVMLFIMYIFTNIHIILYMGGMTMQRAEKDKPKYELIQEHVYRSIESK